MDKKTVKGLAGKRDALIKSLLDKLESKVQAAQRNLLETVLADFVDGLEIDETGNVKNTIGNKRRLAMFDKVFTRFATDKGLEAVKTITEGVGRLLDFNNTYFTTFSQPAILAPIHSQVKETITAWLGLTPRGNVAPNGYLDTLVKSEQVRNQIKNTVLKHVISQGGYNELKKTLKTQIVGNDEQTGALQRYYRNFAYDTFSVVDRTASKITADKLKFNYAVYEGGLVEKSRDFCKEHNGHVYSREEIADFLPTVAIDPTNYNPFTDLGGYGCRHHLNWIPDAIAFAIRPELKTTKPEELQPPVNEETPPEPKAKAFTPAKTMKEAKQTAVTTIRETTGLNIKNISVNKSLTLENFNQRLEQLQALTNEYEISPIWSKTEEIKLSFSSSQRYGGFIKHIKEGSQLIEINLGSAASNSRIKPGIQPFSKIDPGNEEKSTLTHEFAHVISISSHFQKAFVTGNVPHVAQFWGELNEVRNDYTRELLKLNKEKGNVEAIHLGSYAGTNANEFMAEAFTEYKLSSKPSPYAVKVGKLIDKYFKRKK